MESYTSRMYSQFICILPFFAVHIWTIFTWKSILASYAWYSLVVCQVACKPRISCFLSSIRLEHVFGVKWAVSVSVVPQGEMDGQRNGCVAFVKTTSSLSLLYKLARWSDEYHLREVKNRHKYFWVHKKILPILFLLKSFKELLFDMTLYPISLWKSSS